MCAFFFHKFLRNFHLKIVKIFQNSRTLQLLPMFQNIVENSTFLQKKIINSKFFKNNSKLQLHVAYHLLKTCNSGTKSCNETPTIFTKVWETPCGNLARKSVFKQGMLSLVCCTTSLFPNKCRSCFSLFSLFSTRQLLQISG